MINMEEITGKIINYLTGKFSVTAVYIYGSVSKKNDNEKSDMDIAVMFDNAVSALDLYSAARDLECITGKDIDLADFLNSSTILKKEILKNNNLIYCGNDDKRVFYEMTAINDYQYLNEKRRMIIKERYGEMPWM